MRRKLVLLFLVSILFGGCKSAQKINNLEGQLTESKAINKTLVEDLTRCRKENKFYSDIFFKYHSPDANGK